MIGDEILAEFEATNMGWLTDAGELLVCRLHGHMGRLATVPRFAQAYGRYRDACDGNEAWMQEELASLGPDEHPSMHRFDGMNDDAKADLVKVVYTAGWIRLGRALDIAKVSALAGVGLRAAAHRDPGMWYLDAEGLTESVRAQRRVLGRIADGLGCRLAPREMKYQWVEFGNARRPDRRELLVPDSFEQGRA